MTKKKEDNKISWQKRILDNKDLLVEEFGNAKYNAVIKGFEPFTLKLMIEKLDSAK